MAHARLTVRAPLALALALICGCGGAPSSPPTNPPRPLPSTGSAAAPSPPPDALAAASSFTTFTSARFDLALPLPDGASFRVDDRAERWLVARHDATSSVLLVRTWREDEVGNRARCEARARTWRDLPSRDGARLVSASRLAVPPDHDTLAEVLLGPRATNGGPTDGYVLAFGGWAKRCFAYVFATRGASERVVMERLAVMVDGSLRRMHFQSELTPTRPSRERGSTRGDPLGPR
ncbi:hypothetical protein [Polyangium mundeleinium]|uniref:Lipoprotein n=1 Tax=Polyangium mundeleinium TaxID=2995306 RepID=A0ABT5EES3_9BACT|nr:hypothetical protein [Polyangium mundeleinium]MDC0740308.1 hypothetical protein [Polyangium mundeleinium]